MIITQLWEWYKTNQDEYGILCKINTDANRTNRRVEIKMIHKLKFIQCGLVKVNNQVGAELDQAQLKLELDFTLIKICCIKLMRLWLT